MKTFEKILFLCLSLLIITSCGASYQASKAARAAEKEAERIAMTEALEKADFILDITRIIPRGFPSRISTGEYQLRLEGDVVTTRLPFFGVSHEASYGGVDEISIVFDKEKVDLMTDFSNKDRGEYLYRFTGGKGKDKWTVTLQIYDNGTASIGCSTSGGRYMSYYANLVLPETKPNEK